MSEELENEPLDNNLPFPELDVEDDDSWNDDNDIDSAI